MVRLAGRRLELFWGIWRGDGGARLFDEVSTSEAVAMGGRDMDGGGIRNERFFRLRARRPGESGREGVGRDRGSGAVDRGGISMGRVAGMYFGYETDMADGDSGDELGEMSPPPGESKGEMVVVGEDSVEADVMDETLSRCGEGRRRVLTGTWVGYCRG
jgi:hypothetical protein